MAYHKPVEFKIAQEEISNLVISLDEPVTIQYLMDETKHSYNNVRQTLIGLGYNSTRVKNPKGKMVTVWSAYHMNRMGTTYGWSPPIEEWSCWKEKEEKKEEKKYSDPLVAWIAKILEEDRRTVASLSIEELSDWYDTANQRIRYLPKPVTREKMPELTEIFIELVVYFERKKAEKDGV